MQSTLTSKDTDPHDIFVIEPDVVLAARADSAGAARETAASTSQAAAASQASMAAPARVVPEISVAAAAPSPRLDPMFHATTLDDIKLDDHKPLVDRPTSRWVRRVIMGLFAVCSAVGAAAWQHYGDSATQMITSWTPRFAFASSPPAEKVPVAEQAATPAIQAAATDQATAEPAAPAQLAETAAPAKTATAADQPQLLQSMARDLATMGQQIEQLRASIDQIKAGQAQLAAKASEARAESRTPDPSSRPRLSAVSPSPVRPAATAPRKPPKPAYSYSYSSAPAAAAPSVPPVPPVAAAPSHTAPPVQETASDDGPVVRPPMPLR